MGSKGGNKSEGEKTKIRFIMFEADGDAADLQQFAQAITNAVRPTIVQVAAPITTAPLPRPAQQQKTIEGNENTLPFMQEQQDVEVEGVEVQQEPKRSSSSAARKRSLPTPSILDELDLTGGSVPFARYYNEKKPADHTKRYLVIAAWMKEHRHLDEINNDHIYTCYRLLRLNVLADVGGVFRNCKRQGWFGQGSQRGWYVINHLGLNEVNNMGTEA